MTPNFSYWTTNQNPFLVQILIYKEMGGKNEFSERMRKGTKKKLKTAKDASLPF